MSEKFIKKAKRCFLAITATLSSLLLLVSAADISIGNNISVFEGRQIQVPAFAEIEEINKSVSGFCVNTSVKTSVLGFEFKNISADVYKNVRLCPGGNAFGVKLKTDGVIVVGIGNVHGTGESPASKAGLKVGDIIVSLNGQKISDCNTLDSIIASSKGKEMNICYISTGKEKTGTITPLEDSESGEYKIGIWVRDTTAGIGTVTFTEPKTGIFGGLGHGICDPDSGTLLPLSDGDVYDVIINGLEKGESGDPGELRGFFIGDSIGKVKSNTECGIFGNLNATAKDDNALEIALKKDIKCGKAEMICTIDENGPQRYEIEIIKILPGNANTKNFIIKVTDSKLLDKAGGIVQGMSGSPIIQNNKLIGAVTHVLVNDPTKGYGIFIENMLNQLQ